MHPTEYHYAVLKAPNMDAYVCGCGLIYVDLLWDVTVLLYLHLSLGMLPVKGNIQTYLIQMTNIVSMYIWTAEDIFIS